MLQVQIGIHLFEFFGSRLQVLSTVAIARYPTYRIWLSTCKKRFV